jgi:uncharacterized phage-associated protein
MDDRKIINVLAYISCKIPRVTKLQVLKLIYFADKYHLLKYGRSITGVKYYKWDLGPVAKDILNFIDYSNHILTGRTKHYLSEHLEFAQSNLRTLKCIAPIDEDEFSLSELECLNKTLEQFGHIPAGQLIELTHKEYSWINTPQNTEITIDKIAHELRPEQREELIKINREMEQTDKEINHLFH